MERTFFYEQLLNEKTNTLQIILFSRPIPPQPAILHKSMTYAYMYLHVHEWFKLRCMKKAGAGRFIQVQIYQVERM